MAMSFMIYVKNSFALGDKAYRALDELVKDKKSTNYGLMVVAFYGFISGFMSASSLSDALLGVVIWTVFSPIILSIFLALMHLVARFVFGSKTNYVQIFRAACTSYVIIICWMLILFIVSFLPEEIGLGLSGIGFLLGVGFIAWAFWRFACVTNYLYKIPMWKYILCLATPMAVFIFAFFALLS